MDDSEIIVREHKRKELRSAFERLVLGCAAVVILLVIWYALSNKNVTSSLGFDLYYLPSPQNVAEAFAWALSNRDILGFTMGEHIAASIERVAYGSLCAFVIAVPLGLVIGYSRRAEASATPMIELYRTIPPLAWLPVAIAVFAGVWEASFIVFLGVFFPILISTIAGVKAVERSVVDAARTLGAGKLAIFVKVIFPASIPHIMTGVRVGLGVGWMTIVAAEMLGVRGGGVGICLWTYSSIGRMDVVFAYMFVIGIVGFIMLKFVEIFERKLSKLWGFAR